MPKIHTPVDHMFRAGQISSKEWARLHPNEHGGGKGSQKSKMAEFESKEKDEGGRSQKGHKAGSSRHIDRHQEMGRPAHGGGKPSHGGAVNGSHKSPSSRAINEVQKPLFPSSAGRTGKAVSGGTTNPSKPLYGGPPNRQPPQRI